MKTVGQSFVFMLVIVMIGSVLAYTLVVKAYDTYPEFTELSSY